MYGILTEASPPWTCAPRGAAPASPGPLEAGLAGLPYAQDAPFLAQPCHASPLKAGLLAAASEARTPPGSPAAKPCRSPGPSPGTHAFADGAAVDNLHWGAPAGGALVDACRPASREMGVSPEDEPRAWPVMQAAHFVTRVGTNRHGDSCDQPTMMQIACHSGAGHASGALRAARRGFQVAAQGGHTARHPVWAAPPRSQAVCQTLHVASNWVINLTRIQPGPRARRGWRTWTWRRWRATRRHAPGLPWSTGCACTSGA